MIGESKGECVTYAPRPVNQIRGAPVSRDQAASGVTRHSNQSVLFADDQYDHSACRDDGPRSQYSLRSPGSPRRVDLETKGAHMASMDGLPYGPPVHLGGGLLGHPLMDLCGETVRLGQCRFDLTYRAVNAPYLVQDLDLVLPGIVCIGTVGFGFRFVHGHGAPPSFVRDFVLPLFRLYEDRNGNQEAK